MKYHPVQRIKTHLRDHKKMYLVGAGSVVAGAAATLLVINRGRPGISPTISNVLTYRPQNTIEVFVEALGDPGNVIQDTTTGIIYASQGQAAKALGLSPARLSEHLSGIRSHVKGHTFEKLGKAQVA